MTELVVIPSSSAPAAGASQEWLLAVRKAKTLSWLSLVWMGLEGGIAITAGILAGSVALIGFGIDSAIEGIASVVIIWRFTGARVLSRAAEQRAQKLVAIQFLLLAPYVAFEALQALVNAEHADISTLGMVLTASSVIGMPLLGIAKQRVARTLGSQATHGEGTQNLLCAYLAAAVFLGLAGNAIFGAWWLDPIAALFIAAVALHEGRQTWRGQGCCAATALASGEIACGGACKPGQTRATFTTQGLVTGDTAGFSVGLGENPQPQGSSGQVKAAVRGTPGRWGYIRRWLARGARVRGW